MEYNNKTNFYQIPFMASGDYLFEEGERAQMERIDELLQVALIGKSKILLEEGEYTLTWEDDIGTLHINTNINGYSLRGIVNRQPFALNDELTINGISQNGIYHIYLEYSLSSDNTHLFSLVEYEENEMILPPNSANRIKLCVIRRNEQNTENIIVFDETRWNPDGLELPTIAHAFLSENPHGGTVVQENLNITGNLNVNNNPVKGSQYVKFNTGGTSGIEIFVNGGAIVNQSIFVSLSAGASGIGEMWWTHENGHLIIYNSGISGLTAHAKIDYIE